MSLVSIRNLTFSYPGSCTDVFHDVTMQFDTNWKLGLVGRNGRGKTTLLRLLTGELAPNSGAIQGMPQGICFPAPVPDDHIRTIDVLESISGDAELWQIERELSLIGLSEDLEDRAFAELSGGERTKALLAAMFAQDELFALIDEPTNHLDARGRASVARYLRQKQGFVLVSHDRAFLDASVDHILAINRADIDVQKGSFSAWFTGFEQKQKSELQENARLRKEMSRLNIAARRAGQWAGKAEQAKFHMEEGKGDRGFISHRAAKVQKRAKSIEQRSEKAAAQKKSLLHNLEKTDALRLPALVHPREILLRAEKVAPSYDGVDVCAPVTLELRRGERVFLTGPNGTGKSSFIGVLIGSHCEYAGHVSWAPGIELSSVPQNTAGLSGTVSEFAEAEQVDLSRLLTIARKLGVERAEFDRDISGYSEGQKKKLLLARSLCRKAHVYIWDEPLNYIDVYARMQIESMILQAGAAMILVEHDSMFRKTVGTGSVEFASVSSPKAGKRAQSKSATYAYR